MQVVALSDTHIPKKAQTLPDGLWAAVEAADLVIHAGDWVSPEFHAWLLGRSATLLGCWGNNDGPDLRRALPETATGAFSGVRVVVTHETGASAGREARMDRRFPDADLLLFGHSHIPWDSTTPNGLRLLNPGSPTDRRAQPRATWLTFTLDGGVADVELHAV